MSAPANINITQKEDSANKLFGTTITSENAQVSKVVNDEQTFVEVEREGVRPFKQDPTNPNLWWDANGQPITQDGKLLKVQGKEEKLYQQKYTVGGKEATEADIRQNVRSEADIERIKTEEKTKIEKENTTKTNNAAFLKTTVGKKIGIIGQTYSKAYDTFIGTANEQADMGLLSSGKKTVAEVDAMQDATARETATGKAEDNKYASADLTIAGDGAGKGVIAKATDKTGILDDEKVLAAKDKTEDPGATVRALVEGFKRSKDTIKGLITAVDSDNVKKIFKNDEWYNRESKQIVGANEAEQKAKIQEFFGRERDGANKVKNLYALASAMDIIRMPGDILDKVNSALVGAKINPAEVNNGTSITTALDEADKLYKTFWDPEDETCQKAASMAILQALYSIGAFRENENRKNSGNELAFMSFDVIKTAQKFCFTDPVDAEAYLKEGLVDIDENLIRAFEDDNFYVFLDLFPQMLDILGGLGPIDVFSKANKTAIMEVIKEDVTADSSKDPYVDEYMNMLKSSTGDFKSIESTVAKAVGNGGNVTTDQTAVSDSIGTMASSIDDYQKNKYDSEAYIEALNAPKNSQMNKRQREELKYKQRIKDVDSESGIGKSISTSLGGVGNEIVDVQGQYAKKKADQEVQNIKNQAGQAEDEYGKYHYEQIDGVVQKVYHEQAKGKNYEKDLKAKKDAISVAQKAGSQALRDLNRTYEDGNAKRDEKAGKMKISTGEGDQKKEIEIDDSQEKQALESFLKNKKATITYKTKQTVSKIGDDGTQQDVEEEVSEDIDLSDAEVEQLFKNYGMGDKYKELTDADKKVEENEKLIKTMTTNDKDIDKIYSRFMEDKSEDIEKLTAENATKISEKAKLNQQLNNDVKGIADSMVDVYSASKKASYYGKMAKGVTEAYDMAMKCVAIDSKHLDAEGRTAANRFFLKGGKMTDDQKKRAFWDQYNSLFDRLEAKDVEYASKKHNRNIRTGTKSYDEIASDAKVDANTSHPLNFKDDQATEIISGGEIKWDSEQARMARFSGVKTHDNLKTYTRPDDLKQRFTNLFKDGTGATGDAFKKDESFVAKNSSGWQADNLEDARSNFFDPKKNPYAFMMGDKLNDLRLAYKNSRLDGEASDNNKKEALALGKSNVEHKAHLQERLKRLKHEKDARKALKKKSIFDAIGKALGVVSDVSGALKTGAGMQYVSQGDGRTMADDAASKLTMFTSSGSKLGKASAGLSVGASIFQGLFAIANKIAEAKAKKAQRKMNAQAFANLPTVVKDMQGIGKENVPEVIKTKQAYKMGKALGENQKGGKLDTSFLGAGDQIKSMKMHAALEGVALEYVDFEANMGSIPSLIKSVKKTKGKKEQGIKLLQTLAATKEII